MLHTTALLPLVAARRSMKSKSALLVAVLGSGLLGSRVVPIPTRNFVQERK
jgi:hypothetical protein